MAEEEGRREEEEERPNFRKEKKRVLPGGEALSAGWGARGEGEKGRPNSDLSLCNSNSNLHFNRQTRYENLSEAEHQN